MLLSPSGTTVGKETVTSDETESPTRFLCSEDLVQQTFLAVSLVNLPRLLKTAVELMHLEDFFMAIDVNENGIRYKIVRKCLSLDNLVMKSTKNRVGQSRLVLLVDTEIPTPSVEGVAIRRLKNNTAPGLDLLLLEVTHKEGGETLITGIHELICLI
ncbi:hypothetical protein QAD02_006817 [Eretmocerus hayati]|uniref:Uncharacterized protein n=1 Tax=Eretmocerus hayati TaxID=131215 RepID=A0ACC2N1X4_9HYME|nr:hypothetical protein QAD02_006817 [Eretmocerus hayati]